MINLTQERDALFPSNPIETHKEIEGRTFQDIVEEKTKIVNNLTQFALQNFSGSSLEFALEGIALMQTFHFNHFRSGKVSYHYTKHLSEVAIEAAKNVDVDAIEGEDAGMTDRDGGPLDPRAVAFVLGLLHDSKEDFYVNFSETAQSITVSQGAQLVHERIEEKLLPVVGAKTTNRLLELVDLMTIKNSDEFPDNNYVLGIYSSTYSKCVKREDVRNNLQGFPDFCPAYPLLIFPAQFESLFSATENLTEIFNCLAAYSPQQLVPWDKELAERGVKITENILDLFERYNEPAAVSKLQKYYERLRQKLSSGVFDSLLSASQPAVTSQTLIQQIDLLCASIKPALPQALCALPKPEPAPLIPSEHQDFVDNIPLRLLGPVEAWGVDVSFSMADKEKVMRAIGKTARENNFRVAGYLSESEEKCHYHISRFPRRSGQEVPQIEEYNGLQDQLSKSFSQEEVTCSLVKEDKETSGLKLRVILGLSEGYFEGKKKEVLSRVDQQQISNVQELETALSEALGEYSQLGLVFSEDADFKSRMETLRNTSLSKMHTTQEVATILGTNFEVKPTQIYAVYPEYSAPYQEEAVVITADATRENYEKLVRVGDKFKQARFSMENLETGIAIYVEILNLSKEVAAK